MAKRSRKKSSEKNDGWQQKRMQGKTLCIVGTFVDREGCTQLMTSEGGRVVKGVSASLNYLIVGHTYGAGPSSAEQKAEALNQAGKASIQIMEEYDFKKLFVVDQKTAISMLKSGPSGIEHWNKALSHVVIKLGSADFRGCDLTGADLRNANLTGCDFRGASLEGTAILFVRGAKLDKATGAVRIEKAEDCSMKRADFGVGSRRTEYRVLFKNCDLDGACLKNRDVLRLTECTAKRVDFTDVGLDQADVSGTDFSGARFSNVQASLITASGAVFNNADLQQSIFERSAFKDASFRKANLSRARLAGCNFTGADLSGAKLVEADLSSCNLTNANLSKANLRGAELSNADFSGAVLDAADLTAANVAGATLTPEQINSAKGIKPQAVQVGSVGPNIRELEKVAGQSNRVSVSIRVDLDDEQHVELSVDTWGRGWVLSRQTMCGNGFDVSQGTANSVSDGLLDLANRWNRGTPRIDAVEVSASKAPLKKKELQLLAVAAWCEAFGLDVVTEDELKERRKEASDDAEKMRDRAVADLRTSGVKEWNKLTVSQRAALGRMRRLDLAGLDLQSGKFDDLDFQGTDFSGADLRKARFDNSDVKKAKFDRIKAAGIRLVGIKANDASFQQADLSRSHLCGAGLLRADFSGAKLEKADLKFSDIRGASFTGANLKQAKLDRVKFDEKTTFPDGFQLPEELIWTGQGKDPRLVEKIAQVQSAGPIDFETFVEQLANNFEQSRLKKAMKMLKAERFQLFAQVENDSVTGVVKSQTDADLVYSCRLDSEGTFACCTQNLNPCGGLRGALCKHLLVLIVGLTKGEELDPTTVNGWVAASKLQAPKLDKDLMSEVFLKYKGAEAGEIDWRPTETVPEDYYAF